MKTCNESEPPSIKRKPMLLEEGGTWEIGPTCESRFWAGVTKTDSCWIADHSKKSRWGHDSFWPKINGKCRTMHSHRFAWYLLRGPIQRGMIVCHNCPGGDNPACVNPDHLYLGTDCDNVRDCERKGRGVHPCGENHGRSKLTEEKVRQILVARFTRNYTHNDIAKNFGVSQSAVNHILSGLNWNRISREFGVIPKAQVQYKKKPSTP